MRRERYEGFIFMDCVLRTEELEASTQGDMKTGNVAAGMYNKKNMITVDL